MVVELITTTGSGDTLQTAKTTVDGALSWACGCHAVWAMKDGATALAEGSVYKLTVGGVPTAENAA